MVSRLDLHMRFEVITYLGVTDECEDSKFCSNVDKAGVQPTSPDLSVPLVSFTSGCGVEPFGMITIATAA